MTRMTNARLAGFAYLFYIAVAFPDMVLFRRATSAPSASATLAHIAAHVAELRISIVLEVLAAFSAIVLAVALYGITRDEDRDLSVMALSCRVGEGVLGGVSSLTTVGLLWLATASGREAPDPAAANAMAAYLVSLLNRSPQIGAIFFAVGSTLFSWLLLRGRMIPVWLAWLGVISSALLVVALPLQAAGFVRGPITQLMWLPIAAFELTLGPWLLIKGVRPSRNARV